MRAGQRLMAVLPALALILGPAACVPLDRAPSAGSVSSPAPSTRDGADLASTLASLLSGADADAGAPTIPSLPEAPSGHVYVVLRIEGERVAEAWNHAESPAIALVDATIAAREDLDEDERAAVDTVEVSVAGAEVEVPHDAPDIADNIDRGVLGMTVVLDDGSSRRFAPTQMIAENTSFQRVIERLHEDGELASEAVEPERLALFEATQLLVDLDSQIVTVMERGNEPVAPESVTREGTEALANGMADWLVAQLGDDGRMVYEYFPSRGEESTSNNMIRQWMATRALIRVAEERGDSDLMASAATNIAFNLELSYREEGGLGLIADPDGDVKLGAVALAALAISEHPDRERFAAEEAALRRMVDHLWQPDGSFVTFFIPPGRSDNQNFYPGEALLLWASTLAEENDPTLLERFMRSFDYYRSWHREQRNPAFIPWHTLAYEEVWTLTGDAELADCVFEMNDWLLGMQQWEEAPSADVAGRFYDPEHPEYGPPHASSDGVYIEGLIRAHRLAVAVGDSERVTAYRTAIGRGIRHLMQLQFADDVDMFYVSKRDRVAGALRTTGYHNVIRVDNVQHGLLGVLDVLDSFEPEDFVVDPP